MMHDPADQDSTQLRDRDPRGPGPELCGDLNMRIDRHGTWYYQGSPIGRKELVKLFASVLRREVDGSYWLVTPVERGRIDVEDAPFLAVELIASGSGRGQCLSVRTNLDEVVSIDDQHPLRIETVPGTEEPRPYITIRNGLEAKIARPVFYEMVSLGLEERVGEEHIFGVWSNGLFYPLGRLE